MSRISPIDPTTATGEVAAHLATTKKMFGGTPNVFTTAGLAPAALKAMNELFGTLGKSSLGPQLGELVAIAVAQSNRCEYCLSAHTAIGAMYGVDAASLAAAKGAASQDPTTRALLQLAVAINASRGHLTDAQLAAARNAGISDAEIVEVVAHVGLNVYTNYLNNVAKTEIDFPVVPLSNVA